VSGKPSRYVTNNKVNSVLHLCGVGLSNEIEYTGLSGWGYGEGRSSLYGGR